MGNNHGNINNCNTNGTGNTGSLKNNTNCEFDGSNNNIKSRGCVNTKFSGFWNAVEFANEVNLKFTGDKNSVTLRNNFYLQFNGNRNQGEIKSNTYAVIFGNHNVMNINSNIYPSIRGDGNVINAFNNIFPTVEGNNHKIKSLVDTVNHHLKIAQGDCTKNRLEAKKVGKSVTTTSVSGFGFNRTTRYNPWSIFINYVQELSINGANYCMGIFDFNMKPTDDGAAVVATFHHSKYDHGLLNATIEPPGKVTLAATKAGKKETLEMVGPAVSINETKGMTNVRISD